MSDSTADTYAQPGTTSGVPLRGYLIKELPEQVWIRDRTSTWIVDPADVLEQAEWEGVDDPEFSGKPHLFTIRDGAKILEVRPATLTGKQRPLALGDVTQVLELVGADMVELMRDYRVVDAGAPDGGAPKPIPTICMKDDTTGWGIVTKKDD